MSSTSTQILQQFQKTVVNFFDELIGQCPNEPQFIIFRILVKDQLPAVELMNYFISKIYPEKTQIKSRDEKFILEKGCLFSSLDGGSVNYLRKIWRSPQFDDNDRETVWRWLESFIFLIEKYQKTLAREAEEK